MDPGGAPGRVLPGHAADERAEFPFDPRPAWIHRSRLPPPPEPEARSMPAHAGSTNTRTWSHRGHSRRRSPQNTLSPPDSRGRSLRSFMAATGCRSARCSGARSPRVMKSATRPWTKMRRSRNMAPVGARNRQSAGTHRGAETQPPAIMARFVSPPSHRWTAFWRGARPVPIPGRRAHPHDQQPVGEGTGHHRPGLEELLVCRQRRGRQEAGHDVHHRPHVPAPGHRSLRLLV